MISRRHRYPEKLNTRVIYYAIFLYNIRGNIEIFKCLLNSAKTNNSGRISQKRINLESGKLVTDSGWLGIG